MKSSFQIQTEFNADHEIGDLGSEFVGSTVHTITLDFDSATGLDSLAQHFSAHVFRADRTAEQGKLKWRRLVLRFAPDAFLVATQWGFGRIYTASSERAEAIFTEVSSVLGAVPPATEPCFYMLRHDGGSFTADSIENLPEPLDDEFLRLVYGDDAEAWIAGFCARTRERQAGLTILEGPPGTGKTSLVSEMIRRLQKTHLFYVVPVNNDGTLTSPSLVAFWKSQHQCHPDRVKVVVMEDAERLLLGRGPGNRDDVAAVLNIADGLLGRMLRVHLICSVNARFIDLDPAIQRPGRLMNYRTFQPIPRERAVALAAKQGTAFRPHPEVEHFTLAEVLQPSPAQHRVTRRRIGFAETPAV